MVHCHWEYDLRTAIQLAQAVESIKPLWLEDPLAVDYSDSWKRLVASSNVPICTGENLARHEGFKDFILNQGCDILHPDLQNSGGFLLKRELEAAQYTARRAEKQYDTTDPDNRLVASELERRWNEALQKVQQIEARIEQGVRGRQVAPATREEFETLAGDLEAVWNHPETDARLKKRIVRTLIEEVVVDLDAQAAEIIAVVHWKGGVHTELRIPRRRRGYSRAHTPKEIVDAVRVLVRICSDDTIAGALTRGGLVITGMGNRWTRERVTSLRSHHGIPSYSADRRSAEGWLTLTEAAGHLHISGITLRLAIERGEIEAEHPLANGPWVINRSALETATALQFAERSRRQRRNPGLESSGQGVIDFSAT
jgi:hypothetical protein